MTAKRSPSRPCSNSLSSIVAAAGVPPTALPLPAAASTWRRSNPSDPFFAGAFVARLAPFVRVPPFAALGSLGIGFSLAPDSGGERGAATQPHLGQREPLAARAVRRRGVEIRPARLHHAARRLRPEPHDPDLL